MFMIVQLECNLVATTMQILPAQNAMVSLVVCSLRLWVVDVWSVCILSNDLGQVSAIKLGSYVPSPAIHWLYYRNTWY